MSPGSIWDILYRLYYREEEGGVYGLDICFNGAADPIKLRKIREFLGPKCEDYFRFLEFYNGLLLGQWYLLDDECINKVIENHRKVSSEGNKLPIATHSTGGFPEGMSGGASSVIDCFLTQGGFAVAYLPSAEVPCILSHSFEEFMHEWVLGPRYLQFGKEDATYRALQCLEKGEAPLNAEYFRRYGKHSDEDENPTRDPRIMTSYRKYRLDIANQVYEQTKDLPKGTLIRYEFDNGKIRCVPVRNEN